LIFREVDCFYSRYETWEVLAAVGIVAVITLALTVFALQSKWDFTAMGGALLVVLVVLLMFGIMSIFMQNRVVNILYASLGALVFGLVSVFCVE
jgi:protein lifeguard